MINICIGDIDYQIFDKDSCIKMSAISKNTFDKYECIISDDAIFDTTKFTKDKTILYNLILDCMSDYPNSSNNIKMTIDQSTDDTLLLQFESNKAIKYANIDFVIALEKRKLTKNDSIVDIITRQNNKIVELETKLNNILQQNEMKNFELETKLNMLNEKSGNYIIIGDGNAIHVDTESLKTRHGLTLDERYRRCLSSNRENSAISNLAECNMHCIPQNGSGYPPIIGREYKFYDCTHGIIHCGPYYDSYYSIGKLIHYDVYKYSFLNLLNTEQLMALNFLKNLKCIVLCNDLITSLDFIKRCDKLENISILSKSLNDISALSNKKIIKLDMCCPLLTDISPLKDMITMTDLNIVGCAIKNCLILQHLTNLKIIQ